MFLKCVDCHHASVSSDTEYAWIRKQSGTVLSCWASGVKVQIAVDGHAISLNQPSNVA